MAEKSFTNWGLSAFWYVATMGIAYIVLAVFAPRLRRTMVKTVPEYFRRRYSGSAGLITAIIMILPLIGLTASQFIASATIVSFMLNINYPVAVIIVAIVVTAYSIMGGLWSVTITDFVQVFLIIIGMALALPFKGIGIGAIISMIVMYIASFSVGQEAVSRYYAARDEKAAVQGSIISAILNFVYAFIPTLLGIITLALINMKKIDGDIILSQGPKYALPHLAMATMPALIVGLLFSGIISATMSSADSDLLGAGSIFGNDIYKIYIKPNATNQEVMRVTQITMLIVGVFGMLIALFNTGSIIKLLLFSFTLRAAGAFFPYVMGHYWKQASNIGAIASLIAGSIVVIILEQTKTSLFGLDPIIPGLALSFICFIICSKIFKPNTESLDLAEENG